MSLENKLMATSPQIAQFGLLVAQQVVAKMGESEESFSKDELQTLLTPPYNGKVKELVDRITGEVFEIKKKIIDLNASVHAKQIQKLTKYWKEKWNHDIPWDTLVIPQQPAGLNVLEYEPNIFTEDEKLAKYKENHGEDAVWCYYHTQNLTVKDSIQSQGIRPTGPYLYWHAGGQEPDKKHLNKSYDMFDAEHQETGINFAIPTEGITMADRYRFETKKMMDVAGLTFFHALDHDGDAMDMYEGSDGKFSIDRIDRTFQNGKYGPREVVF